MTLLFRSGTFDNEDFAITPYLTLIWPKKPDGYKFFGIGVNFGWWSMERVSNKVVDILPHSD